MKLILGASFVVGTSAFGGVDIERRGSPPGVADNCADTEGWDDDWSYACWEYASNEWCADGAVADHRYAGYGAEENCCACGKPGEPKEETEEAALVQPEQEEEPEPTFEPEEEEETSPKVAYTRMAKQSCGDAASQHRMPTSSWEGKTLESCQAECDADASCASFTVTNDDWTGNFWCVHHSAMECTATGHQFWDRYVKEGSCPELYGHRTAQWLAVIEANSAKAGTSWYNGLPGDWWHGMTAAQTKAGVLCTDDSACPDLHGATTSQWFEVIKNNEQANKDWYIGLPGNWWHGKDAAGARAGVMCA